MINKYHGKRLIKELQTGDLIGRFVPIKSSSKDNCEEVRDDDKLYVSKMNFTGTLVTSTDVRFIYEQAAFGSKIDYRQYLTVWKSIENGDFCGKAQHDATDLNDKAILVDRGGCDFATKAEVLSNTSASLMLVTNYDDSTITMGVEND